MKYTDDAITEAVKKNKSVAGVLRDLGIGMSGGMHYHISRRIKRIGLDTSHMTGRAHNKGGTSAFRLTPKDVFVLRDSSQHRQRTYLLRRCMLEVGIKYLCSICGQTDMWNESKIVLQVDHINGNPHDDRQSNLRFMCPNCHSQTKTFGTRNWQQ